MNIEDLHIKANLTNISQRADKQILCMKLKRPYNDTTYPQIISSEITRQSQKIRFDLPMPTVDRYKYFPNYYGSKLYNLVDLYFAT